MFRWSLFLLLLVSPAFAGTSGTRTTGLIAEGTCWECRFHSIQGDEPGPTVVLVGGVHGDEPAGAQAAEQICQWPIRKGRLVVIPRANAAALEAGTRLIPGEKSGIRDLNRNFPGPDEPDKADGGLADVLWHFISGQKPDWVVDMHEGYGFHRLEPKSVGSSIITGNKPEEDAMASSLMTEVNRTISRPERKFVSLHVPVAGSLARAASEHLGAKSMILETTSKEQSLSLRTRQHRLMVRKFLLSEEMIQADDETGMIVPADKSQPKIAVFDEEGVGSGGPENIEATLRGLPGALIWRIGAEEIRGGRLAGFDLVVFPGGSGGRQAQSLGKEARDEVRRFVEDGGGFVGICAGAYLAAENYPWSLAISNHRTLCEVKEVPGKGPKPMWYRGDSATVEMELTPAGREILGDWQGTIKVLYHNGPIMSGAESKGLPDYEVLAWFRSEVSRYEPQVGTMKDTPAILSAHFGSGRVLCVSPHPEASPALRPLLAGGMRWALRK